MSEEIDIDYLRTWIGKKDRQTDTITPALVDRLTATLSGYTPFSDTLASQIPLGIHWCLAPPAVPREGLGPDSHPATGGFLPPVPLARRMWASSKIEFLQAPGVGTPIARTSTIADVVLKQSADSGPLVFVQIDHVFTQQVEENSARLDETLIQDRQTIVYRQPSEFKRAAPKEARSSAESLSILPDSTLLFRYSALTFNGHRLHYDHNYATLEEGYPGLVVHGPLMATLLMNLAQANRPQYTLRKFEFRAVAPAFVDQQLLLAVKDEPSVNSASVAPLEITNHEGAVIMTACAHFGNEDES